MSTRVIQAGDEDIEIPRSRVEMAFARSSGAVSSRDSFSPLRCVDVIFAGSHDPALPDVGLHVWNMGDRPGGLLRLFNGANAYSAGEKGPNRCRKLKHSKLLDIKIPNRTLQGGQNVNKVNTKVELRFHVASADWMDDHTRQRLALMNANAITREGYLVVTSQVHRTQEQNIDDAYAKLRQLVKRAAKVPKVRNVRTGLSELTKQERREDKRHRGEVKARRRGSWDD